MDYPIASLAALLDLFAPCFRAEVFGTFKAMVGAWALCPGPRTISEVWQATGRAARHHHDTAYALFHSAKWDWDDTGSSCHVHSSSPRTLSGAPMYECMPMRR